MALKTRAQIIKDTINTLKEAAIAHQINIDLFEKLGELGWEAQNEKRRVEIKRGRKMIEILENL